MNHGLRFYLAPRARAFRDRGRPWHPERVPRQYAAGGRAGPAAGAGNASGGPPPVPALRARALRRAAQPAAVPEADLADEPGADGGGLACRLVRAFLPVATLYVGKLIIDEVVRGWSPARARRRLREWLASGLSTASRWLLALEFALAVAVRRARARRVAVDALLSELFTNDDQRAPDGARRRRSTSRTSKTPTCRTSSTARGARPWAA